MKNKQMLFPLITCLMITGLFSSCKKNDKIKANVPVFKVEIFKEQLKAGLADARGFQFVITKDGVVADTAAVGLGGSGRTGNIPADVNAYVNIASVTKMFTAVTVLDLLSKNGLKVDSTIGRWLPDTWPSNAAIRKLTFRQLLTHKSGIRTGVTTWSSLKNVVANPPEGDTSYSYANANFALFRAILPKLDNPHTFEYWEDGMTENDFQEWMSNLYINMVNNYVFENAGLTKRECVNPGGNTHTMMNEAPFSLVSVANGDWTNTCGGGGFYLTTMDMARVMVYMTHSNKILSDNQRTLMDDNRFGLNRAFSVTGGTALGHGGGLYDDFDNSGGYNPGDPGLQTLLIKFPNKVELALCINSIGNDWRNTNAIVQTAYNAAWVIE